MNETQPDQPRWFHAHGRQKLGPLTLTELQQLAQSGQLTPADMVLLEGTTRWTPAADVAGLFADSLQPTCAEPPHREQATVAHVAAAASKTLASFGGFEVIEELGRGGMGVVYKARQVQLDRLVALKMILSGEHAGAGEKARFRTEAEAIARLQHPNIVQIHEFGEIDGRPYFSLEYCDGGSLADKLNGTPLPPREGAEIVETLARAMHFAHQQGIVHRDLKPANVLLAATPPVAKISDFGLARKLDVDHHTRTGAVVGTPSYMAPEQAEGRRHDIGPAVDVWALGAILYECLTGRPPFRGASTLETLYLVSSREPVAPRQLTPATPRDLEVICLKCLQKSPARRYSSAAELADDLQRFRNGEPIRACPVGLLERGWRWSKRRPAVAGLTLALLLALVIGVPLIAWKWKEAADNLTEMTVQKQRATDSAQEAQEQGELARQRLREQSRFVYGALMNESAEAWQRGDLATVERHLSQFLPQPGQADDPRGFEWRHYWQRLRDSRLTLLGNPSPVRELAWSADGTLLAAAFQNLLLRVWDVRDGKLLHSILWNGYATHLNFAPDGRQLAVINAGDFRVNIIDLKSGTTRRLEDSRDSHALAYTPDGKALAVGDHTGAIRFLDANTFKPLFELPQAHRGVVSSLKFAREAGWLLSGGSDQNLRLWRCGGTWQDGSVTAHASQQVPTFEWRKRIATTSNGTALVTVMEDGQVWRWHIQPEQRKFLKTAAHGNKTQGITAVAVTPSGGQIVAVGEDRVVRVWHQYKKPQEVVLGVHPLALRAVAVSPDGQEVATGGDDGAVRVWRLPAALAATTSAAVTAVAYSPTEDLLVSSAEDRTLRLWNPSTGEERGRQLLGSAQYALAFSPDGKKVYAGGTFGQLRRVDVATLAVERVGSVRGGSVSSLAVAPDGGLVAVGTEEGMLTTVDTRTRQPQLVHQQHHDRINAVAFSPDGTQVATAGWDMTVGVIDLAKKSSEQSRFDRDRVTGVAWLPDGKQVLSTGWDRRLRLFNPHTRASVDLVGWAFPSQIHALAQSPDRKSLYLAAEYSEAGLMIPYRDVTKAADPTKGQRLPSATRTLAVSRDGTQVALGGADGTLTLWSPTTCAPTAVLPGHALALSALACSPDGQTLIRGDADFRVRVVEAATRKTRAELRGHTHRVTAVAVSADGRRIASASLDRTVRLWDAAGVEQRVWRTATFPAHCLAFSPDGTTLAAGEGEIDRTGSVELYDLRTGQVRIVQSGRWTVRGLHFLDGGKVLVTASGDFWGFPGEAKLWDVASGRELFSALAHAGQTRCLAVTRDEKLLATADIQGVIQLWRYEGNGRLEPSHALSGHRGAIDALAFSPDGRTLVSVGADSTLRFWQPQRGQPLGQLRLEAAGRCLAFDPAGATLYLGDNAGTLTALGTLSEEQVAALPAREESARALDVEADHLRAKALRRLAAQHQSLGERQQAEECWTEAMRLLEALTKREPRPEAAWDDLIDTRLSLGDLLLPTEPDRSEQLLRQALGEVDVLLRQGQTSSLRTLRARALTSHGASLAALGRPTPAKLAFGKALREWQTIRRERDSTEPTGPEEIRLHLLWGDVLERLGQANEALGVSRAALVELRALRESQRDKPGYWEQVAQVLDAVVRVQAESAADRLATLREQIAVLERLWNETPGNLEHMEALTRAYRQAGRKAEQLIDEKQLGSGWDLRYYGRARLILSALKGKQPERLAAWQATAELFRDQARVNQKRGSAQEAKTQERLALAEVAEVAKRLPLWLEQTAQTADDYRRAAGTAAWCAGMDPMQSEYATTALRYLDEAVRRGYKGIGNLDKADDLAPLRNRSEFKELLHRRER